MRPIILYLHCLSNKFSADKIPVHSHCRRRGGRRGKHPSRKKPSTAHEKKVCI